MSLQIKIQGATPKQGKSLCATCKNAMTVRGQNMEEHVECGGGLFGAYSNRVPFRVAECSAYHPMNVPFLHEMKAIAWNIEARKRGPAGFEGGVDKTEMEVVVTKPKSHNDSVPDY